MGLKEIEGTPAYAAAHNMYGFNMAADATVPEQAQEAAARIYESGIRVIGDQVREGHNNVRADFAASAFTVQQLWDANVMKDEDLFLMSEIILARQAYMAEGGQKYLEQINEAGKKLVASGAFKGRAPAM